MLNNGFNKDGTAGNDDDSNADEEGELVKITLNKLLPEVWADQLKLKLNAGSDKIKVWSSSTKGAGNLILGVNPGGTPPLITEKTYSTPSQLEPPKELWVEGVQASSALRDVQLALVFEKEGSTYSDLINITVIDVDINEPDGSWINDPPDPLDWGRNPSDSWEDTPERFDFQGVRSTEPNSYALTINGSINLSPASFTYRWTLPTSCGTLNDYTIASPTHTPPTTIGDGILRLEAEFDDEPTGIMEERRVKIYLDHLKRDYKNFDTGIYHFGSWECERFNIESPITMPGWNCHGSTLHHWNGSGDGSEGFGSLPPLGTAKVEVEVTHHSGGGGSHPSLGTLNRGDIIVYYQAGASGWGSGPPMHSQTCLGGGTNTYGANNEPLAHPGRPLPPPVGDESFRWAVSTAGDWANDLYLPGSDIMPVMIRVYDKPPPPTP